jgi:hypothetical protein
VTEFTRTRMTLTAPEHKNAWDQLPEESAAAHERFLDYLHQGPGRKQKITAIRFGVSASTLNEQAKKFAWNRRAQAWDQFSQQNLAFMPAATIPLGVRTESVQPLHAAEVAPLDSVGHSLPAGEREYIDQIERYRQEAEAVGRAQVKLARGFAAIATRNLARLVESEKVLSPKDIANLATASCHIAASGSTLWGRAIGIERMMAHVSSLVEMERDGFSAEV